jgi:hypothetical protein
VVALSFSGGRSIFLDQHPVLVEPTPKVFVKITEGTFFVSADWHGGTFLGYSGLLDRLRIGLDCPRNLFYFGESE